MELPVEVLEQVFSFIPSTDQSTLYATCLVSRSWYAASIQYLYRYPQIYGKTFTSFVVTICPSINAHIRHNGLAELVRVLDMSMLVHEVSKSLTARILGRVKNNLERFIAPQASFAINSLAALSKCRQLREVDLSFVSQGIPLPDILRSIRTLDKLQTLHLPRAYGSPRGTSPTDSTEPWPCHLEELHPNGALSREHLALLGKIPKSVSRLAIEQMNKQFPFWNFFQTLGPQLRFLRLFRGPMRQVEETLLTSVHAHCRELEHLSINVELFLSLLAHSGENESQTTPPAYYRLDLDTHGLHTSNESLASQSAKQLKRILLEGGLPQLRILGIHRDLERTYAGRSNAELYAINDHLKLSAQKDGPNARAPIKKAGVLIISRMV